MPVTTPWRPRARRAIASLLGGAAAALALAVTVPSAASAASWTLPPANTGFEYQLGGPFAPPAGTGVVSRDRTAAPAAGVYNICYLNGFQTQEGELAWWQKNHPAALLKRNGNLVRDPDWNAEVLLNTSTDATRQEVAGVMAGWMAGCRSAGFKAVEIDNLDSWTRSRGLLTQANAVAYSKLLTASAHAAGLAIAQKNTVELAPQGRSMGFDFAVAEECQVYNECGGFTKAYGNQVYEVEYNDNGGLKNFQNACKARGGSISITYRDRDLVPAGNRAYVNQHC